MADPDGNHIKALLLRFFILYLPKLIEAGKVYATMPPLYGIKNKTGYTYLRDRMEYVQYIQKIFSKNNTVSSLTSKTQLTPKELSKILYTNIDYIYELKKVSVTYAIEPLLLETILTLTLNNTPKAKFTSSIKKQFRFIDTVEFKRDVTIIEGLVNSKVNTVFLNDSLLEDCKDIIAILKQNDSFAYKLNGNIVSLYELMSVFENSAPPRIQRYKGLGEMDGKRLFDSTLDPTKRSLIQYTIEDIQEEIEAIKFYENNMKALIEDVKITRFDVME